MHSQANPFYRPIEHSTENTSAFWSFFLCLLNLLFCMLWCYSVSFRLTYAWAALSCSTRRDCANVRCSKGFYLIGFCIICATRGKCTLWVGWKAMSRENVGKTQQKDGFRSRKANVPRIHHLSVQRTNNAITEVSPSGMVVIVIVVIVFVVVNVAVISDINNSNSVQFHPMFAVPPCIFAWFGCFASRKWRVLHFSAMCEGFPIAFVPTTPSLYSLYDFIFAGPAEGIIAMHYQWTFSVLVLFVRLIRGNRNILTLEKPSLHLQSFASCFFFLVFRIKHIVFVYKRLIE